MAVSAERPGDGAVCRTCTLLARRDAGEAPIWDSIVRTPSWDIVHGDAVDLEGWLILVLRRHATALADLTVDEASALGPLVQGVSAALGQVLGCTKTYLVQFAEHPLHPHVHIHVIPRAGDLPDESQGPRVFTHLGVPDEQRVPEARMDEIAHALRPLLADLASGV